MDPWRWVQRRPKHVGANFKCFNVRFYYFKVQWSAWVGTVKKTSGSCCCFPFSPDLFLYQIRAVIWFKRKWSGGNFFKMLIKVVGQQFWLFCGTGKNQCGRNDWNFDLIMAGLSTMTMLLCSQRYPSRSFFYEDQDSSVGTATLQPALSSLVPQLCYSFISLHWFYSHPTPWSLCIGSTAVLQLDLSPLVLQPP
jgi:hypothetical protein